MESRAVVNGSTSRVTADLAANQFGVGRELFFNARLNAAGAEQGAGTFGSTLPGPLQTA